MVKPLPPEDLRHVLAHTTGLWEELRGRSIFITGGTGFFGHWLVESFLAANRELQLQARLTLLTRDPEAFAKKSPHIVSDTSVTLIQGDVRDFPFPEGDFTHVIHAAASFGENIPEQQVTDSMVNGTRRVLDFSRVCGAKKFLLTSSGAVYGSQPVELTHLSETYVGEPDTAYGEGKRLAESLCLLQAQSHGLEIKISRSFAFVGPHLSLEAHFAISNFIRDAMQGRPIRVKGDGTSVRSYLYAADLAIWLWTILFRGQSAWPYNVGSEEGISIADLARTVADVIQPDAEVQIAQRPGMGRPLRYVPDCGRARALGLEAWVPLREQIRRTVGWLTN